jgi:hypothetical protein
VLRLTTTILLTCLLLLGAGTSAKGMIYRPAEFHMWDTWVYYHRGTYYLYYLVATDWGDWNGFALATSTDGVHWKETSTLFPKSESAIWQGTGSVWKSPNFGKDGKFQSNFSEQPRGDVQHIYFAESTDLVRWARLDHSYEFRQDPRWYEERGRWDCIYTIPRPGGGLYGYWTATPKGFTGFGFGETLDGIHWTALEPPKVVWDGNPVPNDCEIGAVEKIRDKYYAMVGVGQQHRMMTFTSDAPQGPFRASPKNFDLLSGDCYFARFFPSPDGMMVTHHSITHERRKSKPVCYAAPLKRALVDSQGILRLGYWKGNDRLKGPAVPLTDFFGGRFDAARGAVLEGSIVLPAPGSTHLPGFYIESEGGAGVALRVGPGGVVEAGPMKNEGTGFSSRFRVDRQISFSRRARFRLMVRHSLLEFYLDDILFEVYSLPSQATGRIRGLGEASAMSNLKAWTMSLPAGP